MLKIRNMIMYIAIIALLSACNEYGAPGLIGRIISVEGNRLLVVEGISMEDITKNPNEVLRSGEYPNACWVKKSGFSIKTIR